MGRLYRIDHFIRHWRLTIGAKWSVVLLLGLPGLFGIFQFGPKAAVVLCVSTGTVMISGILSRKLSGLPFKWIHAGSMITGLLIGLTVRADTPLYMIIVGGIVAQYLGKGVLWKRLGGLLNPAIVGRGAIAVLEDIDPPYQALSHTVTDSNGVDALSAASALFKEAGGHGAPPLMDAFLGFTPGSIGETSTLMLLIAGFFLMRYVVFRREAALAMIFTVPLAVLLFAPSPEIVGHAPWVGKPLVYLLGGSTLFSALFFATDPKTIPRHRVTCILFGVGAGVIGVAGKFYTDIPGFEMYGILVMNALTPLMERGFGKIRSM